MNKTRTIFWLTFAAIGIVVLITVLSSLVNPPPSPTETPLQFSNNYFTRVEGFQKFEGGFELFVIRDEAYGHEYIILKKTGVYGAVAIVRREQ